MQSLSTRRREIWRGFCPRSQVVSHRDMIGGMKRKVSSPDIIAILCILGMFICLAVRTRWQGNLPDPLTYVLALASALLLAFRLRRLTDRMNLQDEQEQPKEPSVKQSGDQIDDAQ